MKNRWLLIALVPLLIQLHHPLIAQDDPALADRARELVAEFQSMTPKEPEGWVPQLYELVQLGPSATLPICKALKETDDRFQMRVFGFALRAIGDPRAVPTLIESIPKTLIEPSSDAGFRIADKDLFDFMAKNDLSDNDRESFGFGRPCREIIGAIEKITGHETDFPRVTSIQVSGGELNQYLQKKAYHDFAQNWSDWWADHCREFDLGMEYAAINLPEFKDTKPKTPDAFTSAFAEVGMHRIGLIIQPITDDKNARCFVDLDTGMDTYLNDSFWGFPERTEKVEQWASELGFDLMGMQVQLEGYDEPQYVIRPINLKFWQADENRFDSLEFEVGNKDFDFGEPGGEYVAYYDSSTKQYDPDRQATFFYQTSEGSCGAIRLVAQVTELLDPNGPRITVDEIKDHQGGRLGVKISTKMVYTTPIPILQREPAFEK